MLHAGTDSVPLCLCKSRLQQSAHFVAWRKNLENPTFCFSSMRDTEPPSCPEKIRSRHIGHRAVRSVRRTQRSRTTTESIDGRGNHSQLTLSEGESKHMFSRLAARRICETKFFKRPSSENLGRKKYELRMLSCSANFEESTGTYG